MSKYEVNIKRFALLLLPTFWRKPLLATLAYAMVSPLGYLHTRFVLFRRDTVYRLTHNGQVCYLRAVLNDQFDPIERRITITEEAASAGVLMLHKREEEQASCCRPATRAGLLLSTAGASAGSTDSIFG